jgi:acyl dehydratase
MNMIDAPLYFDDLIVGLKLVSGTHALNEAQIIAFGTEFDPQPFHTDPEAAKTTFFKGLAASGWHTAGISMRLMVEGGLPLAGGLIGAGATIEWPEPTRPGDILQVESEIVELIPSKSRPDRGIAIVRCVTLNQERKVRQIMTSKLVVPRRPAANP